jgi:hypothetical protein
MKDGDSSFIDEARSMTQRLSSMTSTEDGATMASSYDNSRQGRPSRGVESVASLGSGLAHHARSLVGSFACSGVNQRTGGVLATEIAEGGQDGRDMDYGYGRDPEWRDDRRRSNSMPRDSRNLPSHNRPMTNERVPRDQSFGTATRSSGLQQNNSSRSFRDNYSHSPQRVDI